MALLAVVALAVAIVIIIIIPYGTQDDESDKDGDGGNGREHSFPQPIEDGDREYPASADAEESYADAMDALRASLSDGSRDVAEMVGSIGEASDAYLRMVDYYAWVNLDYNRDPIAMKDEYEAWSGLKDHLHDDLAHVLKESLAGSCADMVAQAMRACGLDPEDYRDYGGMTDDEKNLRQRETELEAGYTGLMSKEYVLIEDGREWTLREIQSSDLTVSEKADLTKRLYESQYAEAAEIYVGLVQVRNDIAILKGYDDYADYAYEIVYGRDYTPDQAKMFSQLVGTASISRQYVQWASIQDESTDSSKLSWMDDLEGDGFINAIRPFMDSMGSGYAELLDYMTEYGLLNIYSGEGRQAGAYTQPLYSRGSALIYIGNAGQGYSGSTTVSTAVHEFGHAANMCLNPSYTSCYDILEIHSQGLQALYCTSGLVGNGSSRAMAVDVLKSLLYNVIISGILTELELWAYETEAQTGSLTAEQVCDEFDRILTENKIAFSVDYDDRYLWATIPHLFQSPHYYISYGTSAVGAIELFAEAAEDHDAAKERYLDLVFQQGIGGYVGAVREVGLTDAFDIDSTNAILEGCISAMQDVKA